MQHKLHGLESRGESKLSEASTSQPGLPLVRLTLKARSPATAATEAPFHQFCDRANMSVDGLSLIHI